MRQSFFIRILILILAISCIYSCQKNKRDDVQTMITDNFLEMVDTAAYVTGSFRKPPQIKKNNSLLLVEFNSEIKCNTRIDNFIIDYLNKDVNLNKFSIFFTKAACENFHFDNTFQRKIGKYTISFDENIRKSKNYVGKIDIENLRINGNKAILVLSKSQEDSGITYIVLLSKDNGIWKVIKRDVLYQS